MAFKDDLTADLSATFFNPQEFGEQVTLIRGSSESVISGLYDTPVAPDSLGGDVDAIQHYPRLFVRSADLPAGKPRKGDKFRIASTPFHSACLLCALDYVFEKDGVVVYRCKEL